MIRLKAFFNINSIGINYTCNFRCDPLKEGTNLL